MPQKIERETGITEDQIEYLLTGTSWGALAGKAFKTPDDEARAWKQNRAKLLAMCREKFGMFCRPAAWWNYDAVEPREGDELEPESEKSYLLRHPKLWTSEESNWLKEHSFTRWELLSCSEIADIPYLQKHSYLLSETELEAMQYISTTVAGDTGIQ